MTYIRSVDLLASRRQLFKGVAGAGAIAALAATSGQVVSSSSSLADTTAAPHAVSVSVDWKGKECLSLGDRPLEPGELGRLAALDASALPLLKNVVLNIQRLAPGAGRVPHWHHSVAELNCVLEGTGEMGIVGLDGSLSRIPIVPGTVTCVPQGLMHYMANTGSTELVIAMGFNATKTMSSSLSNALRAFGSDRLAQMSGLAVTDFGMPSDKEAPIYAPFGKLPAVDASAPRLVDGVISSADFSAIQGFANLNGSARDIDAKVIGNLVGESMSLMTLEPGALRDIHWHPHGTELIYIVDGELEWGLQAPGRAGDSSVFKAASGQVVAIPEGWLHYAANIGQQTAKLLVLWESPAPKTIEMTGLLSVLPLEITMASAGTILDAAKASTLIGKASPFISPKI